MQKTGIRGSNLDYKLGFIGASKAGTAFANYLIRSGIKVQGFYSYHFNSAVTSAQITKTTAYSELQALILDSDIIFITVKDSYIHNIWQQIQHFNLKHKIICHLSGLLSSTIFDGSDSYCHGVASLHIPIAFVNKEIIPESINTAPFVVEGSLDAIKILTQIALQTKNSIVRIKTPAKAKYHAACVLSSSLILAQLKNASTLVEQALEISNQTQLSEKLVLNLATSALDGFTVKNNLISSATGPIARNDPAIVAMHLEALQNTEHQVLYKILSNILLEHINIEAKHELQKILK